ncbi:hypothetical protein UVI_02051520 [Ustilaginoidea virens]|uniref:Uncharacterized protein n=1 Tax=Ustilaginoidea virens TaxID=1159556 RepID=A0A1B5KXT4_USTVR|nr:hypothetical protein UVI_02051520 [Ustilaginoidea virens]
MRRGHVRQSAVAPLKRRSGGRAGARKAEQFGWTEKQQNGDERPKTRIFGVEDASRLATWQSALVCRITTNLASQPLARLAATEDQQTDSACMQQEQELGANEAFVVLLQPGDGGRK